MSRTANDAASRLERLAGNAPKRSTNVRTLARFAANADCKLATLGFAARVDFDQLLEGTKYQIPFGQSPFAFRRGNRFEERLRENGHQPMLALFRENLGYDVEDAKVAFLRKGFARNRTGLQQRAEVTEGLVRAIVARSPDAPNLIDGAVLTREVGGVQAYFEADAVAARFAEPIHAGEIKSFPTVDGQADADKVGAAIAQVAIYIVLLREVVDRAGGQADRVSADALLITPKNTALTPTLTRKCVGREVDRAQRILEQAPSAVELVESLPGDMPTFAAAADASASEDARVEVAERLAEEIGTTYRPSCLSACGMSRLCRERAHREGDPARVGEQLVRLLPGIRSLDRAGELAAGAHAAPDEQAAAVQLLRAVRARDALAPAAAAAAAGQRGRR